MSLPIKFRLYRGLWEFIDVVYPPECGGCELKGTKWCSACHSEIKKLSFPICKICGAEFNLENEPCPGCTNNTPQYTSLRSFGYFDGSLRNAIHKLKYRKDIGLGLVFAEMLKNLMSYYSIEINLVLPVPLSKARFRQRGYNQAAIIAYPFSISSDLSYSAKALFRTRETRTQIDLSREARKLNVKNAFWANEKIVNNKTILLIDDVVTTGSTLNSCATALFTAGANQVHCMTVARSEITKM